MKLCGYWNYRDSGKPDDKLRFLGNQGLFSKNPTHGERENIPLGRMTVKDFGSLAAAFGVKTVAAKCDCNFNTKGKTVYASAEAAYEAKLSMDAKDKANGKCFINAYYFCCECNGFVIGRMSKPEPADLEKLNKLTEAPEVYGL